MRRVDAILDFFTIGGPAGVRIPSAVKFIGMGLGCMHAGLNAIRSRRLSAGLQGLELLKARPCFWAIKFISVNRLLV